MAVAPLCKAAFIVRGYRTLSLNPPPIIMSFRLMLAPGIKGAEGETSKLKSKDLPATRVAVKLFMGSVGAFFKVISTVGPPGVIGGMGPVTDTISTA